MNGVTTNVMVVLLGGLVVATLIVILFRGGTLRELDLEMLKGWFKLRTKSDAPAPPSTTDPGPSEPVEPASTALEVLRWIQEHVLQVDGAYVVTETTHENAKVAMQLYTKVAGRVIGTCFFESPDYGPHDFAHVISPGVDFTRLTLRSLCPPELEAVVARRLGEFACKGRLAVVDDSVGLSKIGGVFCKMPDKSYVAFVALNAVGGGRTNRGLLFCGTIAEHLFSYYRTFMPGDA